jgi:hypothetical protein
MATWFTVQLADRPNSLGALASGLGERGVNITAIAGVAEDTDGTLMLATSDPDVTEEVLGRLAVAYEKHDPDGSTMPGSAANVRQGLADRGLDVQGG